MSYQPHDGVIAAQYSDQLWRLNNLYHIQDKQGKDVLFKLNIFQQRFYDEMWYLNCILKARQFGFCLDPSTRVLTADLKWIEMSKLRIGEEIVAVDEYPPGGRGSARKMRTATVQGVVEVYRKAYRITFDDGREVVCTGKHPWLSKTGKTNLDWRTIESDSKKKLRVGTKVKWITKPWSGQSYEDGWFGGMLDGEGSISKRNTSAGVNVSQRYGDVWDRMLQYVDDNDYNHCVENDNNPERKSKFGKQPIPKIAFGRMDEMFKVIGQTRPSRFLNNHFWEGRDLPGKRNGDVGWAEIVKIEEMEEQTMIDLQTSTGTYIAEGFVSHNTTFIDLFILDSCIWNANTKGGIIAHKLEDAQSIFTDKIQYPYRHLPEGIKAMSPVTTERANHYEFGGMGAGSSIRVSTSYRSGTLQLLHVSEYGKIAATRPDKAKEINTGAIEAVAKGQMIFIESTAEGREGEFYDLVDEARQLEDSGKELDEMDFKFHFYAWWENPEYTLNPAGVAIPQKMHQYFEMLKESWGIEASPAQRAWYVKKQKRLKDDMKREYPSTADEAFEAVIDGSYYGEIVKKLRVLGRLKHVPYDPLLPVHTFWDLGINDTTDIIFFQQRGMERRIIDFYENAGEGMAHYARIIGEKPYVYGTHYFPHDVNSKSLQTGKTLKSIAETMGIRPIKAIPRAKNTEEVMAGIENVRNLLATCWIDEEKCAHLIKAMESYRKEWDDRLGTFKKTPLHNWASNAADAMRTGAVGLNSMTSISQSQVMPDAPPDY